MGWTSPQGKTGLTEADLQAIEEIVDRKLDEKLKPLTDLVVQGFSALGVKVSELERVGGASFRR